ncbi:MAG: biopolymer transporter ExbD, partial [Cyanobacteria bacterium P01_D01_bin.2]
ETETSEPQEPADFTVTIESDGSLFLDEQPITEERLRPQIVQQLEPDQEALITIKADEQTYHGEVITVMDELRAIEGAILGIATVPEPVSSETE